jgi:hypothetical protein
MVFSVTVIQQNNPGRNQASNFRSFAVEGLPQ